MKKILLLLTVLSMQTASYGQHFFWQMLQSVDSVKVIYRGYDSLAIARYFGASTNALVQSTFANGIVTPVSTPIQNISGSVVDTVGFSGLIPGSLYTITTVIADIVTGTDTIVIVDSTLSSPPNPVDIGPTIMVSDITTHSALLTVPFDRNGGGAVFVTWEDSVSGGSWSYLLTHQISGTNTQGDDTLTVFQNPNTTRWYRANGINQMFPLFPDTANIVSVTTFPLLANPPTIDSISFSNVTDQGGMVSVHISADSLGGVVFVQIVCGGQTYSLPPTAYSSGISTHTFSISTCGPLDTVDVYIQVISSNPNWNTINSGITFMTSSGIFEIAIQNCAHNVGAGIATVNVLYSSGGYDNNTLYIFAFDENDVNFNSALGFSQIYTGVPEAQQGNFTMYITTGLMSWMTYAYKAYMFNPLGLIQSSPCVPIATNVFEVSGQDEYLSLLNSNQLTYRIEGTHPLFIVDVMGRILSKEFVTGKGEYDISLLHPGMYIATINGKSEKFVKK